MSECMNGWVNGWANERMNKWLDEHEKHITILLDHNDDDGDDDDKYIICVQKYTINNAQQ